jgi:hypothetical protein
MPPAAVGSRAVHATEQVHPFDALQPQATPHVQVAVQEPFVAQVQAVSFVLMVMV